MATDATGTPTSLGIPTFNVDVDAPSGLGSNAQMASIDTLIGARIAKPASPSTGQALVWNGSAWVAQTIGGSELTYDIFSTNVSTTATSEATATTVKTSASFTADGTSAYLVEFFAPAWASSVTTANNILVLFEDATSLGTVWRGQSATAGNVAGGIYWRVRRVPTAGSHAYTVKSYLSSAGSFTVVAGVGGSGVDMNSYIRVTRA